MSVSLSVCLCARITWNPHGHNLPNFLCMLPVVLLQQCCNALSTSSFTDDIMFSCHGTNGPESRTSLFRRVRQMVIPVGSQSIRVWLSSWEYGTRGEVCCLWSPCLLSCTEDENAAVCVQFQYAFVKFWCVYLVIWCALFKFVIRYFVALLHVRWFSLVRSWLTNAIIVN